MPSTFLYPRYDFPNRGSWVSAPGHFWEFRPEPLASLRKSLRNHGRGVFCGQLSDAQYVLGTPVRFCKAADSDSPLPEILPCKSFSYAQYVFLGGSFARDVTVCSSKRHSEASGSACRLLRARATSHQQSKRSNEEQDRESRKCGSNVESVAAQLFIIKCYSEVKRWELTVVWHLALLFTLTLCCFVPLPHFISCLALCPRG